MSGKAEREREGRKRREERHIGIIDNHDVPEIILFFHGIVS